MVDGRRDLVEEIRNRIRIEDIVSGTVSLRQQGKRLVGLCPFHSEKTPSFSVSPEKGLFHCFGCRASGDVFTFVMETEGLDFRQAVERLAEIAGIETKPVSPAEQKKRQQKHYLIKVTDMVQAFFARQLWEPEGAQARDYLSKRGIGPAQIKHWGLGFGGSSPFFFKYLASKQIPLKAVAAAGLLSDNQKHCLFSGRVTLPIIDREQKILGFGGRRLKDEQNPHAPKYINARDSLLFHKQRVLFGWNHAESVVRQTKEVILCEGFFDVIAAHQAGLQHSVAALGTAFTQHHADLCKRFAQKAYLFFDGDQAGLKAAFDASKLLVTTGIQVHMVQPESGADPASLYQSQGAEALRNRLQKSTPVVDYFMQAYLPDGFDGTIPERVERAQALMPLIQRLKSGLERDLYTQSLADRVGVTPEILLKSSKPKPAPKHAQSKGQPQRPAHIEHSSSTTPQNAAPPIDMGPHPHEWRALAELWLYPELREQLDTLGEYLSGPMQRLIQLAVERPERIDTLLQEHSAPASIVLRIRDNIQPADGDLSPQQALDDVLRTLKIRHIEQAYQEAREDLKKAEQQELSTLEPLMQVRKLGRRIRELKGETM